MNHLKIAAIVVMLLIAVMPSKKLYPQTKPTDSTNNYPVWSFSVNGGTSLLFPNSGDDLASHVEYSTSFERIETNFTLRLHKRHSVSINLGSDRFHSRNPNSGYISRESAHWLGLSYSYYFLVNKNSEFFAEAGYGMNNTIDVLNIRLGMSRKIVNDLSFNFKIRYSSIYHKMFGPSYGSQLGFDYGFAYNF